MAWHSCCLLLSVLCSTVAYGELNLAGWRSTLKLKSANSSYLQIYIWQSLTEPPKLNPPIFLQWRFGAQPPNLIPTNISGYIIYTCSLIIIMICISPWPTAREYGLALMLPVIICAVFYCLAIVVCYCYAW